MKKKTIKLVIKRKLNEWFNSIEDEEVRELVKKNTIVTGGCIASMLLKEQVNDFDIYFRNHETAKKIAQYYIDRFETKNAKGIERKIYIDEEAKDRVKIVVKSSGIASEDEKGADYRYFEQDSTNELGDEYVRQVMEGNTSNIDLQEQMSDDINELAQQENDKKYRAVFLSSNAITLSDKIQLVLRFIGKPEEIHENYDFVHATNYYTSWDDELVFKEKALEALLTRELIYVGSKYPLCSLFRIRKFIGRGWTVTAGQMLKAALQLNELNLKNPEVLEDQLVGVDSAYFVELISKIKEDNPEKVDTAYIISIVDRMM